jgi:hypothetical protein
MSLNPKTISPNFFLYGIKVGLFFVYHKERDAIGGCILQCLLQLTLATSATSISFSASHDHVFPAPVRLRIHITPTKINSKTSKVEDTNKISSMTTNYHVLLFIIDQLHVQNLTCDSHRQFGIIQLLNNVKRSQKLKA